MRSSIASTASSGASTACSCWPSASRPPCPGISEVLDKVERVDAHLMPLQRLGESLDTLRESTAVLAETVEPLKGATERLGRIADRLPGARARQV